MVPATASNDIFIKISPDFIYRSFCSLFPFGPVYVPGVAEEESGPDLALGPTGSMPPPLGLVLSHVNGAPGTCARCPP